MSKSEHHDHSRLDYSEHSSNTAIASHDSLKDALLCHIPFSLFAVSLSLICVSILTYIGEDPILGALKAGRLFHSLHFMHLLFAGTGVILTYRKYSKSFIGSVLVGVLVPTVFCTLSDAIIPYWGGKLANLDMEFHWCFLSHISTVLPFLAAGLLNGWVISLHSENKHMFYSTWSHFAHIFISSMASVFYLVSFGFDKWYDHFGFVFLFLIVAVIMPCTLSDLVVPMLCAGKRGKKSGVIKSGCCNSGSGHEKH